MKRKTDKIFPLTLLALALCALKRFQRDREVERKG